MSVDALQNDLELRLEAEIAANSRSRVYRASRAGEQYAVKVPGEDAPKSVRAEYRREVSSLTRLDHPLIPDLHAVTWVGTRPCLCLEYREGRTVAEMLEEAPLRESDVIRLGLDIASALATVHRAELVHRDLHASNLIWNGTSGTLIDFGFSVPARGGADRGPVGSVVYAAPEQSGVLHRPVDERSDLYALGGILYHALAGHPPYGADDLDEVARRHVTDDAPPLEESSDDVAAVVQQLLETEPDRRIPDAARLRERLASLVDGEPDPPNRQREIASYGTVELAHLAARSDETERLERQADLVEHCESGGVARVDGAFGRGRTPLLRGYVRRSRERGTAAVVVEPEPGVSAPFSTFRDLVAAIRSQNESTELAPEKWLDESLEAEQVARILEGGADASAGSELDQIELSGLLARYLGRVATGAGTTVVVIDALHWLDESSTRVLRELVLKLRAFPLQIVLGVATDDEDRGDWIWSASSFLRTSGLDDGDSRDSATPGRIRLELDALTRPETRRFVEAYLRTDAETDALVEHLQSVAQGEPELLQEYLSVVVREFVARPVWGTWGIDGDRLTEMPISDDVRDLQAQRFEELDDATRASCRLAAVWGRRFPASVVAEAAGLSQDASRERLEPALEAGLLVELIDGEEEAYQFTGESVRRSILETVDENERREAHRRLATAADRRDDVDPYVVARHYVRADGGRAERIFETCRRAGRRAARDEAFGEAVSFLERALRAAEQSGREPSAKLHFDLGRSYLRIDRVDDGVAALKRAAEDSPEGLRRGAALMELGQLAAVRYQLREIDTTVRRALSNLGHRVPDSSLGLALGSAAGLVELMIAQVVNRDPARGDRHEAHRLMVHVFDQFAILGTLGDRPLVAAYSSIRRILAGERVGPSYELVIARGSMAVIWALAGRFDAARRAAQRARDIADQVGTSHARARADLSYYWSIQVQGESREAVEGMKEVLIEQGGQLTHFERRLTYQLRAWDLGLRGHSDEVVEWFEHTRAVTGYDIGEAEPPIDANYGTVMVHARARADDELADALVDASRYTVSNTDSIYVDRVHASGRVGERTFARASVEAIDDAIESRRSLGVDAESDPLWTCIFFVYQLYARWYQLENVDEGRRPTYRQRFREAVDELVAAAGGHEAMRAHAEAGRAKWASIEGKQEGIAEHLSRGERLARETDNRWAEAYLSRVHARRLEERELPPNRRYNARRAVDVVRTLGWTGHADAWADEFALDEAAVSSSTAKAASTTASTDSSSRQITALRGAHLQRKMNGLLEVIEATESLLDPEKVQREALDIAIEVLNAERGLIFVPEDDEELGLSAARTREQKDLPDDVEREDAIIDAARDRGETVRLGADTASDRTVLSAVAVPLELGEGDRGLLYLDSRAARGLFDNDDVELLRAIAGQVSRAIVRARRTQLELEVTAERQRRTYAEQLRNFAEDVTAMFDTGDILVRMVEELCERLGADSAAVALRVPQGLRLEAILRDGELRRHPFESGRVPPLDETTALGTLARTGSIRVVDRVSSNEEGPESLPDSIACWLGLPVQSQEEIFGCVALGRTSNDPFDGGEIEGARAYATQAGLAAGKARMATLDPLTSLYNRRKLFELSEREFARAERYETPLSVLMLDLDDFKQVNDTYGHAAGDDVLATVAERIVNSLREVDVVGRYGGEEFGVVLPSTERDDARSAVAERLRREVAETSISVDARDEPLRVTVSIGVATRGESDEEIQDLYDRADSALYRAKREGKDRVETSPDPLDT